MRAGGASLNLDAKRWLGPAVSRAEARECFVSVTVRCGLVRSLKLLSLVEGSSPQGTSCDPSSSSWAAGKREPPEGADTRGCCTCSFYLSWARERWALPSSEVPWRAGVPSYRKLWWEVGGSQWPVIASTPRLFVVGRTEG